MESEAGDFAIYVLKENGGKILLTIMKGLLPFLPFTSSFMLSET